MEDNINIGATSKAVASASTHDKAHVTVGHYYPVVDADTLQVAAPIQLPDPFWTLCDNCSFQFEYEFKYRDLLIKCPQCSNPFVAKENYKVARTTVELVRSAQYQKNKCFVLKDEVEVQKLEAIQPTENVNVPERFQPIGGDGAFRESREKRKMKELITPPGADYKVAQDEHFENPQELHGMPMVASPIPEDVVSELQKIPDLSPDVFLKAFNILRRDYLKCRILVDFPVDFKKYYLRKETGYPLIDFEMDASLGASSTVSASLPSMDIIVATPATSDLAPIPVALQTTFWTWCTNCGLAFEYLMTYQDCLLHCPHCHQTFEAKEKSLDSIIGQTCSSVPQAPNNDVVAAECVLGQPSTQNLNANNKICQRRGSYEVSIQSVPLISNENGSIMQPRQVKMQRKHLSETFGAHYKVPNHANFSKPYEPPAIWKKASPEDVIAELKNIPDLAPMDWIKAFGILRYDDFQFRSLQELPMKFKKKWLLNEIK